MVSGTTGTGLDRIITLITADEGLVANLSDTDIDAGAAAANRMNGIIVEGITSLGLANDGTLTASDIRDLSDWIAAQHKAEFIALHGDDEGGIETGYHLIQGDGGAIKLFGRDVVDTVGDGLYHLVFGYDGDRVINEDGNRNARLEDLAWWLNELLEDDLSAAALGAGPLAAPGVDPWGDSETGTGFDQLIEVIRDDPGLQTRIPTSEIREGAQAGVEIAQMILDVITAQGLANDGEITNSDIYQINEAIRSDPALLERFITLHGDDENGVETGFHLVQGDGATSRLYDANGVNTVADGIFHIGFEIERGRFRNEDGAANATVTDVAEWVQTLLKEDLADGTLLNPNVDPVADGSTGTGLDRLVEIIEQDIGLNQRLPVGEIADGAAAADTMNQLLLDGIQATGAANDGIIQASDMRDINAWLRSDGTRLETFITAHGDDEDGVETGFHLVQNDGALSRLYGENAVNTIADGIYHFGFEIARGRFLNEDGNANQTVEDVAAWLDQLLDDGDMGTLANATVQTDVTGSTGTGLDRIVDIITEDPGLTKDIATSEIVAGASAADGLNAMIVDGLIAVGAGMDGHISAADVRAVNAWIQNDAQRFDSFVALHGDDEDEVETGFHLVQNDGAHTHLFGRNAVDTVADGLYHIGFDIVNHRFRNEDGNANASVTSVATWLNGLLAEDLADGRFYNAAYDPDLVDVAALDAGLVRSLGTLTPDGTGGHVELADGSDLDLGAATVMLRATPDTLQGTDALFSRDGRGYQDGGHLTIFRSGNDLRVRIQTDTQSDWLRAANVFDEGVEIHIAVSFDGAQAQLFVDGARVDMEETTANWLTADEDITVGAFAGRQRDAEDNKVRQVFDGAIEDLRIYDSALSAVEIQAVSGARPDAPVPQGLAPRAPLPGGSTGTGLDTLVEIITQDVGLARSTREAEIAEGAAAADAMNGYIVEALQATGVANDGRLSAGDVRELSDWIAENRKEAFITAHGDDENGTETGFHLVQNDGAVSRLFGDNAVNTVADGLYHLPFGYRGGTIVNEDGNRNQTLEDMAWWLEALLVEELAQAAQGVGPIYNAAVDPSDVPLSGTGLDAIVEIIQSDPGIARKVATGDTVEAAEAATGISQLILDGITTQGLADDGDITASDVRAINAYIRADADRYADFVRWHGDDEDGVETGYHLVQNDGAQTRLYGKNALDTVADGLFHMGFEISRGRFLNEDGNRNATVERVAYWLSELLEEDVASGALDSGLPAPAGTTGTGLDGLVDLILSDPGLERQISELDMREGAEAADAISHMIVDAIKATGVALNGEIKAADIYEINAHIRANSFEAFVAAHGDDEDGVETGFHLVQNDGATTRLYGQNAVNTVADGLFHLGFEISRGHLRNEDGNRNASVNSVAGWLDSLLSDADYAALAAAAGDSPYVYGSTGTGLDQLVDLITEDDGLINRISTSDIRGGAEAAQGLNEIILDAIQETGAANDGALSRFDVLAINDVIRSDPAALARFTALHGDDEDGVETGFHLVQNDGAQTEIFDRNAVNTIADGIYHIGFEVDRGRFLNEDGQRNASVSSVAEWLNGLLVEDLAAGTLTNPALTQEAVDLEALRAAQVFTLEAPLSVTKSAGALEIADTFDFDFAEGTVLVEITPEDAQDGGRDVFFSRDGRGYQDGGHLSMWVERGDVIARFQTDEDQVYLTVRDVIADGETYDIGFTFDGTWASLYLDGGLVDMKQSTADWTQADEAMLIGGSLMLRHDGGTRVDARFEGEISKTMLFDTALSFAEIQAASTAAYDLIT